VETGLAAAGLAATGLAATARATAAWRAVESARDEALFRDPWAAALAGQEMVAQLAAQPPEVQARAASYTIVRTRFFDDWLAAQTDCRQVVLLGAGFDTRAFRLRWPAGTTLWELDRPAVLAAKEAALADEQPTPGCTRRTVAADLTGPAWPQALLEAGLVAKLPTVWLAEGLLPYLEPAVVETLLAQVAGLSAAGSRLGADFVTAGFMAARNAYVATLEPAPAPQHVVLFHSGTDAPAALLGRHGFRLERLTHPGAADADFGRWAGPAELGAGLLLVTAVRA
jgi:methyltransferase (TIGR00027 family)